MRTLKFSFNSKDKLVKKTAILTDDLQELSSSKKNECSEILDDYSEDGFWSLMFDNGEGDYYEVELEFDRDNFERTLTPIKAITWDREKDVIVDVQECFCK